ncbi:hypothetical protein VTP01DRAFT_3584 [Rhizomucor pusillus]|uniref:uncharacterized protein n=1 Tax=Rhizomucor pusillus TaxID=4840 RepID=UPI003742BBE6
MRQNISEIWDEATLGIRACRNHGARFDICGKSVKKTYLNEHEWLLHTEKQRRKSSALNLDAQLHFFRKL